MYSKVNFHLKRDLEKWPINRRRWNKKTVLDYSNLNSLPLPFHPFPLCHWLTSFSKPL